MKYLVEITLTGPAPDTGDLVLEDFPSAADTDQQGGAVTDLGGTNVGYWQEFPEARTGRQET